MQNALFRLVLYSALAFLPVFLANITGIEGERLLQEVGKSFALLGFMIIVLQVLPAARIKWIERAFGLDILIRYHKHMGVFAALLILCHPLLLAAGGVAWKSFPLLNLFRRGAIGILSRTPRAVPFMR